MLPHGLQFRESGVQTVHNLLVAQKMLPDHRQLFLYDKGRLLRLGDGLRHNLRIGITNRPVNRLLHLFKIRIDDTRAVVYDKRPSVKGLDLPAHPHQIGDTHNIPRYQQHEDQRI